MKSVTLCAHIPDTCPDAVYTLLCDFSRYETLCASVRKINVERTDELTAFTDWEVDFQNGVLKWRERDDFDPANRGIRFEQTQGDIEHFSGQWRVLAQNSGSCVEFSSNFDLGMPMLADMLDSVAEKAIRENIHSIITGLFPTSEFEALPV